MKKFLLFILILLVSFSVFSQNWKIINPNDKYNYRLDGDLVITSTIWTDSVQGFGSDSIFFLNRIMCDSCATVVGGPNPCDTCYGLKNQPQFLQRKMDVNPDGVANFRDPENIVINTLAALNDVWVFDSSQNISTTVVAIGTELVFGNSDSVKTLLLSTGDTVKYSKNYGILQYPSAYSNNSYYRLVGIEGRNLGEQVPKFSDFFNFDVGDMFEYYGSNYFYGHCLNINPDYEGCEVVRKYLVTDKYVSADTLFYELKGQRIQRCSQLGSPWNYETCIDSIHETVFYVDSADHVCNKFNREYFSLPGRHEFYPFIWVQPNRIGTLRMIADSNEVLSKSFGTLESANYYQNYFSDTLYSAESDTICRSQAGSSYCSYAVNYKVGLGVAELSYGGCFEFVYEEHLVAYRKGVDTVGTFTPDSVFTVDINEHDVSNTFLIYPNPADEWLNISITSINEAEISIIDLQGKILKRVIASGTEVKVDVSRIENGMYFISIRAKDKLFSRKILIMH